MRRFARPGLAAAVCVAVLGWSVLGWSVLGWSVPALAESGQALRVLELNGQRWRAVGTLRSSVTGAELVIFEEETTRRSKIARRGSTLAKGVSVRAVSHSEVLLDVAGRATRLAIARGTGTRLGTFGAASAPRPEPEPAPAPPVFGRVQLTLAEFQDTARTLRDALRSGRIAPGYNEHGFFGLKINESAPGSLTARLGLKPGDVVVAVNGMPAASEEAANALLDAAAPDRSIPFAFRRGEDVGQGVVEVVGDN